MREQYIIVVGDPASGFYFHGPFDDADAALDWAAKEMGGPYWLAKLDNPEKE